ncbi:DUF3500 domain-containing protein [Candidatus Laterigemmans baculatus]|uniref:DUF3500 domain-containing protein n=1 Tax=Candidatus Laterigemmans baculatus TaxID=2770505 RepID=UPI0013DB5ACD|nr:DUF3500 domain-containing protein [Candidatus Laterigemmans baculatus]
MKQLIFARTWVAVFRHVALAFCASGWLLGPVSVSHAQSEVDVVIVVGAGGTDEYAAAFSEWAERWEKVATEAQANVTRIGPVVSRESESVDSESTESESTESESTESGEAAPADRELLLESLEQLKADSGQAPLWLVLIGHGTFQQEQAKFNLRGPDLSAAEFAKVLEGAARPLVIVNAASSSGPFLAALSGENRVVVTATRSGEEQNFARFGDYLSRAIGDRSADLDHDASVSILEAFLAASHQTQQFYEREGRLATEHALLDDNGDGKGTPADFFRGMRVVGQPAGEAEPDGPFAAGLSLLATEEELALTAEQRERIAEIEQSVRELRGRKSELDEDAYYAELEPLMVELAKLCEQGDQPQQ